MYKTHKTFKIKLTCMILSLLMIMCTVPTVPVWAEDAANDVQESAVTETTATSTSEVELATPTTGNAILSAEGVLTADAVSTTVTEVTSLREESIKHFKLPDGTYQAVIYADAVHRMDSSGQWQNIDNRLYLSQDSKSNTEAYRTTDGRTSFAKSYTANEEIFSITEDGYAVSVSMISNQLTLEPIVGGELVTQAAGTTAAAAPAASTVTVTNAPAKANPNATEWASIEAARAAVGGDDGSIVYTNVAPHTDLEYVLKGNDIKENIIVKATALSYVYRFRLDLTGLTATLTDSGSVSLHDADGIEQLVIPVPYMYDASGAISYDVTYGLATNTDGSYTLTVTADPTWVNDADRVFPVTIDPTITKTGEHIDTYVAKDQPEENFEGDPIIMAGYGSSSNQEYVSLIRMPYISTIPSWCDITSASLAMTYSIVAGGSTVALNIHRITRVWGASSATWNGYESTITYDTTPSGMIAMSSSFGTATFDLTTLVQGWHEGTYPNYGFLLKANSASSQCPAYFTTASAPAEAAAYYPVVTIEYAPEVPDGVYALGSVMNTDMWIVVTNGSVSSGVPLRQSEYHASPADIFHRQGLFKIAHIAGTDQYVIRCMTNNRLGLGIMGNLVQTVEIPEDDLNVPVENRFRIHIQDDLSVVIQSCADSQLYITSHEPSIAGVSINPILTTSSGSYGDYAKWMMTPYSGSHRGGIDIIKSTAWINDGGIDVSGGIGTASCISWATIVDANVPVIVEHSSDVATVTWNATSKAMSYMPHNVGVANLTGYVKNNNGATRYMMTFELPVIPAENEYFLRNVASGRYAALEELSIAEGVAIQESSFHSADYHNWIVEHVPYENGYVRIKLVYSGLYIGSDYMSSSVNQYDDVSDDTLWRFERTASGNVKLVNKSTGMVMSADSGTVDGGDLIIATYTNDQSYWDEWECHPVQYRATVNIYYDHGYHVRYGESENDSQIALQNYTESVANRYMQLFGLDIEINDATYFNSAIDQCKGTVTASNIDVVCTHGGTRHTNRNNVFYNLDYYHHGNSLTTSVLWTCHRILSNTGSSTPDVNRSCSYNTAGIVLMLEIATSSNRELYSQGVLMHELNHQYGAPDHYHEVNESTGECLHKDICSECGDNPRLESCIMNHCRIPIDTDTVICDDCRLDIINHLDDHHVVALDDE